MNNPAPTPTPTCQNLVMRERDGVVGIWTCGGKAIPSVSRLCFACAIAAGQELIHEDEARVHYSARRGKA